MSIDYSQLITAEDKFNSAKDSKLAEIDRARDIALLGGFTYGGHEFDSDSKSIQRISAIATLSQMLEGFETHYITRDNQTIKIDGEFIRGLGLAAAEHEALHVFKARALKDLVLEAESYDDLSRITWDTEIE